MELSRRKITIMGLGRHGGGVAAARYCAQAGAQVTVTDLADEKELAESVAALRDVPIAEFVLDQHREASFSSADIVVVNPAVKPGNRFVDLARKAEVQITSETELFLDACPGIVVGVTGTVGKSTTAAMLAAILKRGERRAWLGGNIGNSLLADLPRMSSEDVVVLEMSSFQLFWLSDEARWPRAAIVTNCSPNHLDWHGTWEHYVEAKKRLVSHLPEDGFAVLGVCDGELAGWKTVCRWEVFTIDSTHSLPALVVPGEHNRLNAACAARMAKGLGIDQRSIDETLAVFMGLPHRLQLVCEIGGRRFYNDSKSTTPTATMAALNALKRDMWLLLGGASKGNDFAELVEAATNRVRGVAIFGEVADRLSRQFRNVNEAFPCYCGAELQEALRWCWENSKAGEAILLSPGCASTDRYRDFAHRGEEFERMVRALEQT